MEAIDLRETIEEVTLESFETKPEDPFGALDGLLDIAEESRQLQGLAEISGEALSQPAVDSVRYYLHCFALIRLGELDKIKKPIVSLCGKLEHEEQWGILSNLLPKILDVAPTVEAARYLAKVGETIGVEKIEEESLRRAYDLYPDEERLAYLMGNLAESKGNGDDALGYWAESLEGFARLKRWNRLEEAILRVADSEKPEVQRHVLSVIHRLAEASQWSRFTSFLELSLPGLRKAELMVDLWKLALQFAPKAPDDVKIRKWIRTLAPEAFPEAEGILDLLSRSGILDPQIGIDSSIKRLEALLEFAPGFQVLHASWGVGAVRLNDGDTIVIDFQDTKNHRMKLTLARRALTVIPPDDLRVLQAQDPAKLKRLVKTEQAEIVFQALRMMKGEATTQELRRSLTGQRIIASSSWASWWKDARSAIEDDDRVDLSQSFRQVYRLRGDASDEDTLLALPVIEPRRGIRPNLNLIRRFLEQHPDETSRAARVYTPIIERWARDEKTSADDRLAIHLQLFRWRREVRDDFYDAYNACLASGVEMSSYADTEDQKLLARVAVESVDNWPVGCLFALSSRSAEIRNIARERMRQDPDEARSAINDLLHEPFARPLASLAVIEMALEDPPEPFSSDPWRGALAAVLLVDTATKEQIRAQALGWLGQKGRLLERARNSELDEVTGERWARVLRRWRTSERFLKPVLEFLVEAGHPNLVDEIRAHHTKRTARMLGRGADLSSVEFAGHLMTQATFQKLLHERNHLVWELKTTIPEAIRKARELGDLRENAEYDAAKNKQADFAHRVGELSGRLAQAQKIEELKVKEEETGPGTEILVVDINTNKERTFWLLGEGDDWLGENVISYATPLGRNFLNKKVGDRVSVVGADIVHDYVIRAIAPRLPTGVEESQADAIEPTKEDLKKIAEIEAGTEDGSSGS